MSETLSQLYLIRHGDTEWSEMHRHTGLTDLQLNDHGLQQAQQLGKRLQGLDFACVFTSPLLRAQQTCPLAGFAEPVVSPELVEWNYGDYEGLTTEDIIRDRPDWNLFRDGVPRGESPYEVAIRADSFIAELRRVNGDVVAFSSAHIIRVIAARWLGLDPEAARYFLNSTASLSILGYEHSLSEPVIHLWNDIGELH